MLRFAVLWGLLAIAAAAWSQEAAGPISAVLTLEQAVALALQNNRLVHKAALEVDKATDWVAAARTQRFPVFDVYVLESYLLTPVDFTFHQGAFGTFPSTGPIPSTDTTIRTERRPTTLVELLTVVRSDGNNQVVGMLSPFDVIRKAIVPLSRAPRLPASA